MRAAGLSFTVLVPSAFVSLSAAALANLPPHGRARIVAAGPFHNVLMWGVLLLIGSTGMGKAAWGLGYRDVSAIGRVVLSVDGNSPLHGYLPPGSVITALDDTPIRTTSNSSSSSESDVWFSYLTNPDARTPLTRGWCAPPPPDTNAPCCSGTKTFGFACFTTLDSKSPHPKTCLDPIPLLTAPAAQRCASAAECVGPGVSVCVRPDEAEQLLRLTVRRGPVSGSGSGAHDGNGDGDGGTEVILWSGPTEEVWEEVRVGTLRPRLPIFPLGLPLFADLFWEYLVMASLSLYLFNLLPLPHLDGTQLLSVLLDMALALDSSGGTGTGAGAGQHFAAARDSDEYEYELEAAEDVHIPRRSRRRMWWKVKLERGVWEKRVVERWWERRRRALAMQEATSKILESATHRTLHAHAFSRSSSQASLVLTDLLARYLALLSSTCAKYATHAGRTRLSVYDALGALEDLGLSVPELTEYATGEGKELARYAVWSTRLGVPYTEPEPEPEEELVEDEEGDEEMPMSPSSNPPSPLHRRKRPRTADWDPPDHIPDFLPPFPATATTTAPTPAPQPVAEPTPAPTPAPDTNGDLAQTPTVQTPAVDSPASTQPLFDLPTPVTAPTATVTAPDKPLPAPAPAPAPAPTPTVTSASASDYLVQVPYSQSSLSQVAEWHLPSAPPPPRPTTTTTGAPAAPRVPMLATEPALFAAYHHILTHPPSTNAQATLARHRVAMALLAQTQSLPRWDPPDTLFGSIGPCPPRVASIGPTYAMPVSGAGGGGGGEAKEFKFPPTLPRAIAATERIAPLVTQQGSRIPDLARSVLPPTILSRTSRLTHPPPLQRGSKLLVYGTGVPAPWNANALPPGDGPVPAKAKEKEKEKDEEREDGPKPVLPDARLYATWECETKDFRVPIVARRVGAGRQVGGPGGSGVISLRKSAKV
ncbi:hypothetical protein H0H81_012382 [Sphagnurus paluster]|uniref:Bromodomain associated domain-containing protein n=1 Tax=Sphagnurus paluster TaxID=117069 RepID=A0A9P7FU08_9AGAR|nr:hypothetical protein H0H81_012382 [Sphagnurus paluster]